MLGAMLALVGLPVVSGFASVGEGSCTPAEAPDVCCVDSGPAVSVDRPDLEWNAFVACFIQGEDVQPSACPADWVHQISPTGDAWNQCVGPTIALPALSMCDASLQCGAEGLCGVGRDSLVGDGELMVNCIVQNMDASECPSGWFSSPVGSMSQCVRQTF